MKARCKWVNPNNELYIKYHDTEWGVPVHDDKKLFEMLILEGAQAGLSWETILKKRENYREAFMEFNPREVSRLTEKDELRLLQNEGIVRNRLKIKSAIANAKILIGRQEKYGSFDRFLWEYVSNKPINYNFNSIEEIPTRNELSDTVSKDLKKLGMSFVGSTIMFAYLQAIGMVNAHTIDCFRNNEITMLMKS